MLNKERRFLRSFSAALSVVPTHILSSLHVNICLHIYIHTYICTSTNLTNNRAKQRVGEDFLIRGFVAFHSQFVENLSTIQLSY